METLVLVVHVLVAVVMIVLILLQQGKGAEMGASFGSGASGTVFGSAGSAGFLTKLTAGLALVFFLTSLGLAVFAKQQSVQATESLFPAAGPASVLPVLPEAAIAPVAPVNSDLPTTSK
ncbi:MAG: preprotein translocase subunit SecG [Pseudomonadota bacterium]